jgi:hypothetical protein
MLSLEDNPLGDYIGALNKLRHLPAKKVLAAHQDIFEDLVCRINQLIAHHEKRKEEIAMVIEGEPKQAYEISSRVTWDTAGEGWETLSPLHKRAAVLETVAHLECMRWEGKVKRIIESDNIVYQKLL